MDRDESVEILNLFAKACPCSSNVCTVYECNMELRETVVKWLSRFATHEHMLYSSASSVFTCVTFTWLIYVCDRSSGWCKRFIKAHERLEDCRVCCVRNDRRRRVCCRRLRCLQQNTISITQTTVLSVSSNSLAISWLISSADSFEMMYYSTPSKFYSKWDL